MIGPRIKAHETLIQFEGPSNLVNRTLVVLETEFLYKFPGVLCSWASPQTSTLENRFMNNFSLSSYFMWTIC